MAISKKEFITKLALKMHTDEEKASKWLDGVIDTLYDIFKTGEGVTLTGLGSFYLSERRESTAFKFNPSQKLRKLLGWSSSYKGEI
ncbi:MAG: HU family DNA-binding protein [Desulfamplus sp.]